MGVAQTPEFCLVFDVDPDVACGRAQHQLDDFLIHSATSTDDDPKERLAGRDSFRDRVHAEEIFAFRVGCAIPSARRSVRSAH
jgi:hypothetical protein